MKMLVREIAQACGGTLLCGDENQEITFVTTDSRQAGPGALFVPIVGENVNAHRFLDAVSAAGATAVLTQEHAKKEDSCAWIAVSDTRAALQAIASAYRSRFSIPLVGVTGSVGKTTTKEMLALALSAERNVMKTEGNFNSQLGVPLTLFRLEPEHQAAIIEMGMSEFGEMARLAKTARPTCAVMTNIGISHIENLGTQENICSEKLHITDSFTKDSVLFLNGDDPILAGLRGKLPYSVIYFGTGDWCDFRAEHISFEDGSTCFTAVFGQSRLSVSLPVPGTHNVLNALASLAVAQHLGVSPQKAAEALQTYQPPAMRQQIHTSHGITIIDDSYNASPDSMRSSINILMDLKGKGSGRAVAVLADMLELGEHSRQAHFETGVYAAAHGVDALFVIGQQAREIRWGALSAESHLPVFSFCNNQKALETLLEYLKPDDVVVIKGSRGMKTDEIVRGLLER
ncbi:UDP-N-acetylmuramoyl-tripeptide--D-alanyl-D-alanine ligase [Clostridium minihomine]|uniref:UDP-N-acetylmuramoyl-tripeptide--D-alanyl-D- alanine ligase n=1 Tax=Clostridium minihomine TaxID=2045012 RepID=UPI000C76AADC|nr:UDP-N-acetylmuramoyl-tripeptide--D-alanyl-D-alanine ligase [Clostridium minihomine]